MEAMTKTNLADLDGFTPVIDCLVKEYGLVTAVVFGRIWRYCQMKDGVCQASVETISNGIGVDRATVIRHRMKLVESGYLKDLTPNLKNRPHTFVDTGKVTIVSKIGVAQRNTITAGVAECDSGSRREQQQVSQSATVGVAESHMKIVLKKDIKKDIKKPSANISISSSKKRATPEGLPEPTGDALGDWLEIDRQAEEKNKPLVSIIDALTSGFDYNFPRLGEEKKFDRIIHKIAKDLTLDGRNIKTFIEWAKNKKRDPYWYHNKPDQLWGDWPQAFSAKSTSVHDILTKQVKEMRDGSPV